MPDISLTDDQHERIEAIRAELEAAFVGPYGHLRTRDAVDYLLDTYTPPETADGAATTAGGDGASGVETEAEAETDPETTDASQNTDGSPLQAVAKLLADNDDVWRESDGETRYEVDLPDGTTEPCRTKDDVKRLLFKHYR